MTLRDALAAAVYRAWPSHEEGSGGTDGSRSFITSTWRIVDPALPSSLDYDAILDDPAFRAALTEAVEGALEPFDVIDYATDPHGWTMTSHLAAGKIVDRLLRDMP